MSTNSIAILAMIGGMVFGGMTTFNMAWDYGARWTESVIVGQLWPCDNEKADRAWVRLPQLDTYIPVECHAPMTVIQVE